MSTPDHSNVKKSPPSITVPMMPRVGLALTALGVLVLVGCYLWSAQLAREAEQLYQRSKIFGAAGRVTELAVSANERECARCQRLVDGGVVLLVMGGLMVFTTRKRG